MLLAARLSSPARTGALFATRRQLSTTAPFVVDIADRANFDSLVLKSKVPVVLDAYADWCPPCKALTPVLEAAISKQNGKVLLAKLNTDDNDDVSAELRVRALPTVLAFRNGKVVDSFVGLKSPSDVEAFVRKLAGAGQAP